MKQKEIALLLHLFHEIDILLLEHGASKHNPNGSLSNFDDKVNNLDSFEQEPTNPGNIGYKFELKDGEYSIKKEYKYDKDITKELKTYELFNAYQKHYEKYRRSLLGGHYYTLKKIAYERRNLLDIYNYEIENYKLFIKDCHEMIKYLRNPNKKPFFSHYISKFTPKVDIAKVQKPKKRSLWYRMLFSNHSNENKIDALHYGFFTPSKMRLILFSIVSGLTTMFLYTQQFLSKNNIMWSLLAFLGIFSFLYFLPNIFKFFYTIVSTIFEFIVSFFEGLLELIFNKNTLFSPLAFLSIIVVLYFTFIYKQPSKHHIQQPTNTISSKCHYYYVQASKLHVRLKKSTQSDIIHTLIQNERVCVIKEKRNWSYIKNLGWVYNRFLGIEP